MNTQNLSDALKQGAPKSIVLREMAKRGIEYRKVLSENPDVEYMRLAPRFRDYKRDEYPCNPKQLSRDILISLLNNL